MKTILYTLTFIPHSLNYGYFSYSLIQNNNGPPLTDSQQKQRFVKQEIYKKQ